MRSRQGIFSRTAVSTTAAIPATNARRSHIRLLCLSMADDPPYLQFTTVFCLFQAFSSAYSSHMQQGCN
jgi:hypothetical protein